MNEQPKLRGDIVFGAVPIDVPRGITAELDVLPRGLNDVPTRYRAQSILAGLVGAGLIRDALLPAAQAQDVIAWHERDLARQRRAAFGHRHAWVRLFKPIAQRTEFMTALGRLA